jgi:hypothetical protein
MAKINNIAELRRHAVKTLEQLEEGNIQIQQAAVTAKLYDSVIHSITAEINYYKMIDKAPCIPFIEEGNERNGLLIEYDNG